MESTNNAKKSKEQAFWDWFVVHQEAYYNNLEDEELRDELFENLDAKLHEINEDLVFEFSPLLVDKRRELVISADGISDAFPAVIELVEQSPDLDDWIVKAFRSRVAGDAIEINLGGLKLSYDDIFFRFSNEDDEFGVELNIKNYDESPKMMSAVYVLLDSLIGEFDTTTAIDWIEWTKLDEANKDHLMPFVELRRLVDSMSEF